MLYLLRVDSSIKIGQPWQKKVNCGENLKYCLILAFPCLIFFQLELKRPHLNYSIPSLLHENCKKKKRDLKTGWLGTPVLSHNSQILVKFRRRTIIGPKDDIKSIILENLWSLVATLTRLFSILSFRTKFSVIGSKIYSLLQPVNEIKEKKGKFSINFVEIMRKIFRNFRESFGKSINFNKFDLKFYSICT